MDFNKQLEDALHFDALDFAEKITGKDYHDDKATGAIGLVAQYKNERVKKQLLTQNNDVFFNMPLESYIKCFMDIGFGEIYHETFISPSSNKEEDLYCFWEKTRSILLVFDTYTMLKKGLNGGQFFYNWKPNNPNSYIYGRSGHFTKDFVWVGYYDCREGVRYIIGEMDRLGKFISPWVERPFIWISSHKDHKKEGSYPFYHLDKITEERLKKFPEDIQALIPPKNQKE